MSASDKICADSCKDSDAYDVNDMLQNMTTVDNEVNDTSVCANCGKEGVNNICNKCNMVRYCNAVCKRVHKKKHKKDCEEHVRLATEKHNEKLRIAAELHDEKLFKQPPPKDDCPICFLRLPSLNTASTYFACCGKLICCGCVYAPVYDSQGNIVAEKKCLFCRTPVSSPKENIRRLEKRVEANDAEAIAKLGCFYRDGTYGYPQDYNKALELFHRSAELGYSMAYNNIGAAYSNGRGVEVDKNKAIYYYELAAMEGNVIARYNLGNHEAKAGSFDRALKHYMIAAASGHSDSLTYIKQMYSKEFVTKDVYMEALQSYQAYLEEIKSKQRDDAAAAREDYRYY